MGNGKNWSIRECISVYECMSEIVYTLPSQEKNKTVNSDLSSSDRQRKMGVSRRVYQPSLVTEIVYIHTALSGVEQNREF